jgi:beta-mannosidase
MRTTLVFLLNLSIMSLSAQSDLLLHSGWEFRSSDSREWLPAVVPGSVHTDLVRAGAIPQPFFGTNEDSVQWIEEKDWEYQLTFTVPDSVLSKENARLVFDGLDTYAEVMLNGELILRADNMHRAWKVDVKDFLQTENTLLIRFTSPIHEGKRLSKDIPFRMPVDERIFTRKAQYQYGWDWGPSRKVCKQTLSNWKPKSIGNCRNRVKTTPLIIRFRYGSMGK